MSIAKPSMERLSTVLSETSLANVTRFEFAPAIIDGNQNQKIRVQARGSQHPTFRSALRSIVQPPWHKIRNIFGKTCRKTVSY